MKTSLIPDLMIFDLDNTLYDYELCHSSAMLELSKMFKMIIPSRDFSFEKAYLDARREVKLRIEGPSSHSRMLYFNEILANLSLRLDRKLILDMVSLYWSTFFKFLKPAAGLEDFLRRIRLGGSKIAVVTNFTTEIQYQKLFVLNLLELFDVVVTSEEAGGEKDSFRPFNLMMKRLGMTETNSTWFFGDEIHDFPLSFPAESIRFFGSPFMKRPLKNVKKVASYESL